MIKSPVLVFILFKIFLYEYLDIVSAETVPTSASVVESTSSVPTTIFREPNPNTFDTITINSEKRDVRNPREELSARRATQDPGINFPYVWKWDEWCQYQPEVGSCDENITRYYYNSAMDDCLEFQYSGCNANKNNFKTSLDCERYCKGTGYILDGDDVRPSFCYFQPITGICKAFKRMYYYDITEKNCEMFTYSGCGGNYNRFESFQSCMEACQKNE